MLLARTSSRCRAVSGPASLVERTWSPDVDAFERRGRFVIRIDLPGIPPSDILIDMSEDDVTVAGRRSRDAREREDAWCFAERAYGRFVRVIPLPVGAWPEKALATLGDGVLEIRVPVTAPERRLVPALGIEKLRLAVSKRPNLRDNS